MAVIGLLERRPAFRGLDHDAPPEHRLIGPVKGIVGREFFDLDTDGESRNATIGPVRGHRVLPALPAGGRRPAAPAPAPPPPVPAAPAPVPPPWTPSIWLSCCWVMPPDACFGFPLPAA